MQYKDSDITFRLAGTDKFTKHRYISVIHYGCCLYTNIEKSFPFVDEPEYNYMQGYDSSYEFDIIVKQVTLFLKT